MASTMFNASVKKGEFLTTGGYQTPDGRNEFTILNGSHRAEGIAEIKLGPSTSLWIHKLCEDLGP